MIRIGVIGYGYWGPNIVRNFHTHDSSEVVLVCDKNPKTQERLRKSHPGMEFTTNENEVLKSPKIDLIAVVTPVWTHYELAKQRSRTASTCLSKSHSLAALRRRKN